MSNIEKTFGFGNASPYKASTFNRNNAYIFGRNGGLEVGSIYKQSGNVIIENIKFVQNGIITNKTSSTQVTFPVNLPSPFYLSCSVPDNRQTDNIAWSFVRRPQDIGPSTVLVAEWDGFEFRILPEISIGGLVKHRLEEAIAYQNVGFNTGFRFLPDLTFANYTITPGRVTDKTGFLIEKKFPAIFAALPVDPEYNRYDTVLWRRPTDSENRIGSLILRAGPTFSGTTLTRSHVTTLGNNTYVNHNAKIINPTDNSMVVLFIENYGNNGVLKFTKYAADRSTELVVPTSIASNVVSFDAVLDKNDNIMIVYCRDGNLYRLKISNAGAILVASASVDGLTNPISGPSIRTDYLGNFYIAFLYEISPTLFAPYFLKLNTGGTVSVASKRLINSTSNYSKVSFDVTEDFHCFVAYENKSSSTIEVQELDEVGNSVVPRAVISNSTLYGLVTLAGASRNPNVHVAENNDLFITYEQNKGVGAYGLAVYSPTFVARYNSASVMKDFDNSSENILNHKLELDWQNHGHLLLSLATKLVYFNYFLPRLATRQLSTFEVSSSAVDSCDVMYDRAGSLIQTFSQAQSGSSNNGSPISNIFFGAGTYGTENVFVAANEVAISDVDMSALSPLATLGDSFIIANSSLGNNGTYLIDNIRYASINGVSHWIIRNNATTFIADSSPVVTAQFTTLNGTRLYFAKQTPATVYTFQDIKAEELDSDIIGSVIRRSDNLFLSWYDESMRPVAVEVSRSESFLTSSGPVHFDKDLNAGTLSWSAPICVREPFRNNFKIPAGSVQNFSENKVLYVRLPSPSLFEKEGDADGFGYITLSDVSQFQIGQKVFIGDSDSDGVEAIVLNMTSTQLIFGTSMAAYSTVRGAYIIPIDVNAVVGEQNKDDLKPDSFGFVRKDIFAIAIRADDLVQFRNGALTLMDQEDGNLGDGPGDDTLAYIGAPNAAANAPSYGNNYAGTNGQSLTARVGALDSLVNQSAQDRNVKDFFPSGITFTWNATSGLLSWMDADWHIQVPNVGVAPGTTHTINTAVKTLTIGLNQVAYVDINRLTGTGDLTPIVVNDNALPLNFSNQNHLVIARRLGTDVSIGINGRFFLADGQITGDVAIAKLLSGGSWSWVVSTSTLTWTQTAYLQVKGLSDSANRILAGSVVLDTSGKVAYVDINRASPGGTLTVLVDFVSNILDANSVIIARRINDNLLIETNLLEDGSVLTLDRALTDNMFNLLGFTSNGQTVHNYANTYNIAQSTSHEAAIGLLDLALKQIQDQLNVQPDAYIWLADGTTDVFTIGTGGHGDSSIVMSSNVSINDIMVVFDGEVLELDKSGVWPIADGDTNGDFIKVSSTTIRIKSSRLADAGAGILRSKIVLRPYASGATNVVAVQDEGVTVSTALKTLNFTGMNVIASETTPGVVDIAISGSGGGGGGSGLTYELYTVTNNTGALIPAKKAVRFLPNNRIELCDNTVSGKKNPIGITVAAIPDGATVTDAVAVGKRIPGVLAGLGFGFNESVYLGQNGDLVNEASVPDTSSLVDALLQIGEAYGVGTTTTDLIWDKQEFSSF
jgi:hypothetical protein